MGLRQRGIRVWFAPARGADFWLACGVQGDPLELHRQGMLLLMTERGAEAVSVACELWRRTALHRHDIADLLMGGYAAWVPFPERAPADAERFLRWVLEEVDRSPAPGPVPADGIPTAWLAPLAARYRVQGWACGQLLTLARAGADDGRIRRAESIAYAVYTQMHPALATPAATAFLAEHAPPAVPAHPADQRTAPAQAPAQVGPLPQDVTS